MTISIQSAVSALQAVEGSDGTFWRYARACELIVRAKKKKGDKPELDEAGKSALVEARKLLGIVAKRKPDWPRVALCEAEKIGRAHV